MSNLQMEQVLPRVARSVSMKLIVDPKVYEHQSVCEPSSPDSGFSSDDSNADVSFCDRFNRAKTLPSALRRSRSKQSVKRVRFADSLGLDLENLQYFVEEDLVHHFANFSLHPCSSIPSAPPSTPTGPRLTLLNFPYRSEGEYNEKARVDRVCVSALRAAGSSIVGQVSLLNVAFNKLVTVRYTTDEWCTYNEIKAKYSHRLFATADIDAFNFTITLPTKLMKCELCVKYSVGGEEYWDNNDGANYVVHVSGETPINFCPPVLPKFGTMPTSHVARKITALPAVPNRWKMRKTQRRWGRSAEESDDESNIYEPTERRL